jgi:hypothetical protein
MQNRPHSSSNFRSITIRNNVFSIRNTVTTETMQFNSGEFCSGERFLFCIVAGTENLKRETNINKEVYDIIIKSEML